mmetsp:Transcript_7857/g.12789  ORF Transcript_7857/g.12789 Transcript_7857/m.12789 type:complete len:203 (+) Transcript_7857:21-629(+)
MDLPISFNLLAARRSTLFSRQYRISAPTASAVSFASSTIFSNIPGCRGPALCIRQRVPRDGHKPRCKTALPSGIFCSSSPSQSSKTSGLVPSWRRCTLAPAARSRISTVASAKANDAAVRATVRADPSSSKTIMCTSIIVFAYRSSKITDSSAPCRTELYNTDRRSLSSFDAVFEQKGANCRSTARTPCAAACAFSPACLGP